MKFQQNAAGLKYDNETDGSIVNDFGQNVAAVFDMTNPANLEDEDLVKWYGNRSGKYMAVFDGGRTLAEKRILRMASDDINALVFWVEEKNAEREVAIEKYLKHKRLPAGEMNHDWTDEQ